MTPRPQKVRRRSYQAGWHDGVEAALGQLEGRANAQQGPPIELTDELRDWIATTRARLDEFRAEEGLDA